MRRCRRWQKQHYRSHCSMFYTLMQPRKSATPRRTENLSFVGVYYQCDSACLYSVFPRFGYHPVVGMLCKHQTPLYTVPVQGHCKTWLFEP